MCKRQFVSNTLFHLTQCSIARRYVACSCRLYLNRLQTHCFSFSTVTITKSFCCGLQMNGSNASFVHESKILLFNLAAVLARSIRCEQNTLPNWQLLYLLLSITYQIHYSFSFSSSFGCSFQKIYVLHRSVLREPNR